MKISPFGSAESSESDGRLGSSKFRAGDSDDGTAVGGTVMLLLPVEVVVGTTGSRVVLESRGSVVLVESSDVAGG